MVYEEDMLQIGKSLISLDLIENFFCCDLSKCKGECCIEGDAGAPITDDEYKIIKDLVPILWDDLLPSAKEEINRNGVGYIDEEGDWVTSIVDGKNCVFTYYGEDGTCLCAIEKAHREGRTDFYKPISCHLYPVRLSQCGEYTAVNYHRWKVCKAAEVLGRKENIRVYQFLEKPLIRKFGKDWYDELCLACKAYLEQFSK